MDDDAQVNSPLKGDYDRLYDKLMKLVDELTEKVNPDLFESNSCVIINIINGAAIIASRPFANVSASAATTSTTTTTTTGDESDDQAEEIRDSKPFRPGGK